MKSNSLRYFFTPLFRACQLYFVYLINYHTSCCVLKTRLISSSSILAQQAIERLIGIIYRTGGVYENTRNRGQHRKGNPFVAALGRRDSDIKPKGYYIPILDHVLFAFEPDSPFLPGFGIAAGIHKIVVGHDLRPDEPSFHV